jgi:hypothetical protein
MERAALILKGGLKMKTEKMILTQYENADEEQRLCMFMAYRDLRDDFIALDMKTNHIESNRKSDISWRLDLQWLGAVTDMVKKAYSMFSHKKNRSIDQGAKGYTG